MVRIVRDGSTAEDSRTNLFSPPRNRAPGSPAHGQVGRAVLAAVVEFLAAGWVVPVVDTIPGAQFRDPLVNVIRVVKIDVPGIALRILHVIDLGLIFIPYRMGALR